MYYSHLIGMLLRNSTLPRRFSASLPPFTTTADTTTIPRYDAAAASFGTYPFGRVPKTIIAHATGVHAKKNRAHSLLRLQPGRRD